MLPESKVNRKSIVLYFPDILKKVIGNGYKQLKSEKVCSIADRFRDEQLEAINDSPLFVLLFLHFT